MRHHKKKSRRNRKRDRQRQRLWQLKHLEKKRLLAEAHWDKRKAEQIAMADYPLYDAEKGDVVFGPGGYVHPGLRRALSLPSRKKNH
jgi:hypothetical protein